MQCLRFIYERSDGSLKAVREQFPRFTRATGPSRLSICKDVKAVEQSMRYDNTGREME